MASNNVNLYKCCEGSSTCNPRSYIFHDMMHEEADNSKIGYGGGFQQVPFTSFHCELIAFFGLERL